MVSWGLVAVATGFVRSAPQLYAARFLLGVAEAGFVPGILLYLTYWFRQREQAQVVALFIAAAPVSGLILDHAHWLAISSWRSHWTAVACRGGNVMMTRSKWSPACRATRSRS